MENKYLDLVYSKDDNNDLSFESVYYLMYRPLYYYGKKILLDDADVQDLVADTFVKLHNSISSFQNIGQIKSFLYTTLRNASLNFLRHQKIQHNNSNDISDSLIKSFEKDHFFDKLVLTELVLIISQEVSKLPKKQQEVFKLLFFEEFSPEEVSAELGITIDSVYNNKKRALDKLSTIFKNKDFQIYLIFIKLFLP